MPSIIEQIERDALSDDVPVSALLRRVKLAAVKLGLANLDGWVDLELTGYTNHPDNVPDYRRKHGVPVARHPYRGWEQIGGHVESISTRTVFQSIASLEDMVAETASHADARIHFPYSDALVAKLNESNDTHGWPAALQVDRSAIMGLLDQVRNLVLDWALGMEKAGILGSEFNFTDTDKKKAQAVATTITIGNIGTFAGNLGTGNTSGDITMSSVSLDQVKDLAAQLIASISQIGLSKEAEADLRNTLEKLTAEAARPRPKASVISGLLGDLRNALSGAAGNLIAMGAMMKINAILAVPSIPF